MGLEEDACREVEDVGHRRVYRTDRLGMPLIEVVTAPELNTPYEAYLAAQAIRTVTRSTDKVRVGIGSARQDVNVSISGGTRVEIKGVSRIPRIPYLVHNEAVRQKSLLDIKKELRKRGLDSSVIKERRVHVGDLLRNTAFVPIRRGLEKGWQVKAVRLDGFSGILKKEIQPGRSFLMEFSDRVRVVACLDLLPNLSCSDFEGEELSREEWDKIRKAVKAQERDAVIVVWGGEEDIITACEEIEGRAREAFEGVPSETRQALKDNINGFERILPGPDRMYPDTDLPPKKISEARLHSITVTPGLSATAWVKRAKEFKLSRHLSAGLFRSGYAGVFLKIAGGKKLPAPFTAAILVDGLAKRKSKGEKVPDGAEIEGVFKALAEGRITKDTVKRWADGKRIPSLARKGESETKRSSRLVKLRKEVEKVLHQTKPKCKDPQGILDYYIGRVKAGLKNEFSGGEICEALSPLLQVGKGKRRGEE